MAKSPLENKKRIQRLKNKIEETRKKAYIKGTPEYTDEEYEESPEEIKAHKKETQISLIDFFHLCSF